MKRKLWGDRLVACASVGAAFALAIACGGKSTSDAGDDTGSNMGEGGASNDVGGSSNQGVGGSRPSGSGGSATGGGGSGTGGDFSSGGTGFGGSAAGGTYSYGVECVELRDSFLEPTCTSTPFEHTPVGGVIPRGIYYLAESRGEVASYCGDLRVTMEIEPDGTGSYAAELLGVFGAEYVGASGTIVTEGNSLRFIVTCPDSNPGDAIPYSVINDASGTVLRLSEPGSLSDYRLLGD
jgi:hypothetical protein